jgi:zinc finger protein
LDLSGNIPDGRFKKGGALIKNDTARAAATERGRRAGAVKSRDGRLQGLVFDSSSSDSIKEVMRFDVECYSCGSQGDCRMCMTDVPHFKEVIIMAFTCEVCGWRDVEVKGGGAVPPHGTITALHFLPSAMDADRDLMRDVIKSDTAAIEIPELDLFIEHGSLGGLYTTVEGLLNTIKDKLVEGDPFSTSGGDSADVAKYAAFMEFINKIDAMVEGNHEFTLKITDPMSNSWVYSPTAPEPDPRLSHETYTRSIEENMELGILDMKTENYGEDQIVEGEVHEDMEMKDQIDADESMLVEK